MKQQKDFSEELTNIVNFLNIGEVAIALQSAKDLLSEVPNDIALQSACAGIFINGGSWSEDIEWVNLGVSLIEKLIETISDSEKEFIANLKYNLSNGYSEQANLLYKSDSHNSIADELLQKQKHCLQDLLLNKQDIDAELLPNVISNYANLLCDLGRYAEAVDYCYDCLDLDPDHAVAMCNGSTALQKLIHFSAKHNNKVLYEAWRLMKEASQRDSKLISLAGQNMVVKCHQSLEAFEEHLMALNPSGAGAKGLEEWIIGFEKIHTWKPSNMLKTLRKDRLLLTVNPRPSNCPAEYEDAEMLNLVTKLYI
jgi:tetratricopeptide (TPR) repeat protein